MAAPPRILTSSWTLFPVMDPIAAARFSAEQGFAGIEIECHPLDFWPGSVSRRVIQELRAIGEGEGLLYTIHAPDEIAPATPLPALREAGDRIMAETIELANRLLARLICLHPGTADELKTLQRNGRLFDTDRYKREALLGEARARSLAALSRWAELASDFGVRLAVENEVHVPFSVTPSVAFLKDMIQAVNHEHLVAVFDTGHAFIGGGLEHEWDVLKPHIRHLHLNDNRTNLSEHLPLGEGKIDFRPLVETINSCRPTLVLELFAPSRPIEALLASRQFLLELLVQ